MTVEELLGLLGHPVEIFIVIHKRRCMLIQVLIVDVIGVVLLIAELLTSAHSVRLHQSFLNTRRVVLNVLIHSFQGLHDVVFLLLERLTWHVIISHLNAVVVLRFHARGLC